ncbi:MAG: ATP-dependent DNA helicase RecG, partial [Hominimerdicola sp.]
MISGLQKPIEYLKGVGLKRAGLYGKLGIATVWDLLNHFPRDYIDYTSPIPISQAPLNESVIIKGRIVKKMPEAHIRKGLSVYKAIFTDDETDIVIVIYNNGFFFQQLELEREYILCGKLSG